MIPDFILGMMAGSISVIVAVVFAWRYRMKIVDYLMLLEQMKKTLGGVLDQ